MKNSCLIVFISCLVFAGCSHKKNANPFKNSNSPVASGQEQVASETDTTKKVNEEADKAIKAKKAQEEADELERKRKANQDNKERADQLDLKAKTAFNGAIMLENSCLKVAQLEVLTKNVMKYASDVAKKNKKSVEAYFTEIADKKSKEVFEFIKFIDGQIQSLNSSKDPKLKLSTACPTSGISKVDDLEKFQISNAQIKISKDKNGKEVREFIGLDYLSNSDDGTNGNRFCLPACIDGQDSSKSSFGIVPYAR
ncbi:MAG: hypothetical protein QE271_12405 [Bacteriovoracaceae bacterium]|nr:hypothetical protein [Bacteriovoracaceae bacterium]